MKIRSEQAELAAERDRLQAILADEGRLRDLIIEEIERDAEKYGDERRSPLTERPASLAMDDTEIAPTEAVTVVLSERGWVRSGKGHELDPEGLSYKAGDRFLAAARLRSNQQVVFLDSTGRSYSLPAHTLPSARGQGEPLTGRLDPPTGAAFVTVLGDEPEQRYLLASDAGYGFICPLEALFAKPKSGKALLSLPEAARVLTPVRVPGSTLDLVAAATSAGRLLVFAAADLPELVRGKGNKIIGIPSARAKAREEVMTAIAVVPEGGSLTLVSGKRTFTLKPADLDHYRGERGRRGAQLPRGFQKVDGLQ
jgi:topoisomerase-4 subunit A